MIYNAHSLAVAHRFLTNLYRNGLTAPQELRTERNLSIEKVGQLSGVKIADIDRLERSKAPLDRKVLAKVAGCYGLSPTLDVQPADL